MILTYQKEFAIDTTAVGWSLANARSCARWAALAYDQFSIVGQKTNTQVLVVELDNCIVVAFRGTKEAHDFLTDAECWRRPVPGGEVHAGFLAAMDDVMVDLIAELHKHATKPLVICGHSLGGALAMLAADAFVSTQFAIHSVYTIGAPRWCNGSLAKEFNATIGSKVFRIANEDDPVPMVPGLLMGYRGAGQFIFLTKLIGVRINPPLWAVALANAVAAWIGWRQGRINLLANHDKQFYITKLNNLTA